MGFPSFRRLDQPADERDAPHRLCYNRAMSDDDIASRVTALEDQVARISRGAGKRQRHRDGRDAICLRVGAEIKFRVHRAAKMRGETISDFVRPVLEAKLAAVELELPAVIMPSSPASPRTAASRPVTLAEQMKFADPLSASARLAHPLPRRPQKTLSKAPKEPAEKGVYFRETGLGTRVITRD